MSRKTNNTDALKAARKPRAPKAAPVNAPEAATPEVPEAPEAPAPKAPRERKLTVVRVVEGRSYTYQNLGGGRIDCGDHVAQALRGLDLKGVYEAAAKALQTTPDALRAAYEPNSNPGRQRMTLSNLMRLNQGVAWVAPAEREAAKAAAKAEREAKWAANKAAKAAKKAAREQAAMLKAAAGAKVA